MDNNNSTCKSIMKIHFLFQQDVLREILELNQDVNILCTEKKKLPSNEEIKIIIIINVSRGSILPLLLGPF